MGTIRGHWHWLNTKGNFMKLTKLLTLMLMSIILFGCGSKKPSLPISQIDFQPKKFPTTIYHNTTKDTKNSVELYAPKLRFKAIDNKSYESQFSAGMQMFVKKYHSIVLKAGEHRVKFYYDAYSMTTATLNFKQNHKYLFDFYITSYRTPTLKTVKFWIYDLTDKKVVWGKKDERIKY